MTIGELYSYLDTIAPFNNQDKSDNAGLLVGDCESEVRKILLCLDVTNKVVAEAVDKGFDLIISHHPLTEHPISKLSKIAPLHALISHNINLIAVHTNLDVAVGGIADLMLEKLGFPKSDIVIVPINHDGTGYGRIIELDVPVFTDELVEKCKIAFDSTVIRYVDSKKPLSKIGVTSGSAEESVEMALNAGCDAFICGEVTHDRMIFSANYGLTLIEAGHFHTEDIFCDSLLVKLKSKFKEIEIEKSTSNIDVCDYSLQQPL